MSGRRGAPGGGAAGRTPTGTAPTFVRSRDGTPIAVFRSGDGPPIVLVHGAGADHTTFRVVGPRLAERFTVHALDRRGRGASADGPAYAIEREFEDVAAVIDAAADLHGRPVDLVGHSLGGRCGLGAALLTANLRRLVVYESAPAVPPARYLRADLEDRLRALVERGEREEAFALFMTEAVGMTAPELAAYRANPVWPTRVASAHTIVREVAGANGPAASLEALGEVRQPVLQLVGGASRPIFHEATAALHARLRAGRVAVIDGAKHAAHHTHPDHFMAEVETFLGEQGA